MDMTAALLLHRVIYIFKLINNIWLLFLQGMRTTGSGTGFPKFVTDIRVRVVLYAEYIYSNEICQKNMFRNSIQR